MTAGARLRGAAARAGLALAGVAAALAVGEVLVRALPAPPTFHDAVRAFSAAAVEADPVLGHRLRPGARVEVGGVAYAVSAAGFRGPEPADPRHGVRVLVLGDSVTMGWGVPEEAAWPRRLEASLRAGGRDVEVVNAAVLGYGTGQEAALLERLAPALRPDLVLVGYYPNDAEPAEAHTHLPGPAGSALWRRAFPALHALAVRLGLAPDAVARYRALHAPGSPGRARLDAALDRLAAVSRARGVPVGLVLLPALLPSPYPLADVHAAVSEAARARGLPVLDLAPALAGLDPAAHRVAPDDPHPDAAVHALLAEGVAAWIAAGGLLAPPAPAGP